MDADSESQLYDHVEFLTAGTNPQEQEPQFSKSKPPNQGKKVKKTQVHKLLPPFFC